MKARLITILLAALSSAMCFSQTHSTIYTKGGKAIEVIIYKDMHDSIKQLYNEEYCTKFPNATMLSTSTITYNCHSYTWNLSDGGNTTCWINQVTSTNGPNIAKYWTNDYYTETTEANAKKVFYYQSDHSAIVSETVPGMYESKWGAMPLMRHAPDYGPYLNMNIRKYYNHIPPISYGVITCSYGTGEIPKGVAADYYANFSNPYSMVCSIETAKGDDAIAEGYAEINSTFKGNVSGVNVTFNRIGIYEMCLRFYDKSHRMVGEFNYEPIVIDN